MADLRRLSRFARFLRDIRTLLWAAGILVALFVADNAHAQTVIQGTHNTYSNMSAAMSACQARQASIAAYYGPGGTNPTTPYPVYRNACIYTQAPWETHPNQPAYYQETDYYSSGGVWIREYNFYHWTSASCTAPAVLNTTTHMCETPSGPSAADIACGQEPESFTNIQFPSGSLHCDVATNCLMRAANLGDGGEVQLVPHTEDDAGKSCDTGDWDCPDGYTVDTDAGIYVSQFCRQDSADDDGDGINNEDDPTPDEPGTETRDTDGDGTPDNQDAFPLDPENGKDKEDGETANTSTGGGNCASPPVSHGDAIAAQVAYQAWSTRCAVERMHTTLKAGTGSVTVVGGGTGSGESAMTAATSGELAAELAAADGGAGDYAGPEGVPGGDVLSGGLDDSGFLDGESRTCPDLPELDLTAMGGGMIDLNDRFENFCYFMEVGGWFVLVFAGLGCAAIMRRAV